MVSRLISDATLAATTSVVTQPGYLVEMLFNPPFRVSSRGEISALGNDWVAWGVTFSGIGVGLQDVTQSGSMVLNNAGTEISALALAQKFDDIPVNIWAFYGDATNDDDPVLVFAGVGGAFTIGTDGKVTVQLARRGSRTLFSPRHYMTPQQGFNFLPAAGTKVNWGNEIFTMQSADDGG
jgi:hypothetical protein